MLDDRDYMRREKPSDWRAAWRFRFKWSWTTGFLAAYLVIFLTEMAVKKYYPGSNFFNGHLAFADGKLEFMPGYLPLSLEGIRHGYVWQLVTYQFMHAGWVHLLLNGWVIFMFGRELEAMLGGKKFVTLMLSSGIIGGVFQVLVALLWPQYFGTHLDNGNLISGETVGASACAFGLVAAFAAMFPERELTMLLLFVIPVHLRAKSLLVISGIIALIGFGWHFDHVAHAAHLGGMAMGWFYVRKILGGDWSKLEGFVHPAEKRPPPLPSSAAVPSANNGVSEEQVNAVLDKISAQGIGSLSRREREILEKARNRMGEK